MTSADAIDQEILKILRKHLNPEDNERFGGIAKTIINVSRKLKDWKAGNPNFSYIVSEDVYKFLQEAEKRGF